MSANFHMLPQPWGVVQFADLRQVDWSDEDLSGVTFVGCLVNGLGLRRCRLSGVSMIGCFAAAGEEPVDLSGAVGTPELRYCFLGSVRGVDIRTAGLTSWPAKLADAAKRGAFGNNVQRHEAVRELARAANLMTAPVLTFFTNDEEWDVRAAGLRALVRLHQRGSLLEEASIVEFALRRLGDENSLVVLAAIDVLHDFRPDAQMLQRLLAPMSQLDDADVLRCLRTVASLVRAGCPEHLWSPAFHPRDWDWALDSASPAVRSEYLYVMGVLDVEDLSVWRRGLDDSDPSVRARCLVAVRLLSNPPPHRWIEALIADTSPEVRIEALFALGQNADRSIVARAVNDPDEDVRRYARMLLDSTGDGRQYGVEPK